MILDTTTKSIEAYLGGAITSNQLPVMTAWADHTTTTFAPGGTDILTNGVTAVTIVGVPGASTQRQVKYINIYNYDTVAATVYVRLNNNSTMRILMVATLQPGETLMWSADNGWQVITNNGQIKTTGVLGYQLLRAPQILTGSGTYTTPAGCRLIVVECIGGGGGGGGCSFLASNCGVGGGGASGAYARKTIISPAATYAYVCGAAGTAGANTGGNGGTGGDTTWAATLIVAKGGLGGVGMVYGTAVLTALGGAGVVSTGGDINQAGQPGEYATRLTGLIGCSGAGGSNQYGGGGAERNAQNAGLAGNGYGAGGGGGCSLTAAVTGGAGTVGVIIVTEYY